MNHWPKDLSGVKFGKLTVIGKSDEKTNQGVAKWLCRCDCGNLKVASRGNLTQGYVTSCGCARKHPKIVLPKSFVDLSGKHYGKLTVRCYAPDTHPPRFICDCECGNIVIVDARALKRGNMRSCGCGLRDLRKSLVGERFGRLNVVERAENYVSPSGQSAVRYVCKCDCGNVVTVTGSALRKGATSSCGCITSHAEEKINKWLDVHKKNYKRQFRFEQCRDKLPLPFDFVVFNSDGSMCAIEADGVQHYKPKYSEEQLALTQKHDDIKNDFCKTNSIRLLRIPYWEFDNIDKILEKELAI